MNCWKIKALMAGCSVLAVGASPAFAQQVSPTAAPASAEGEGGIADIIVTARRKEESAQNVPLAVTAFSPIKLKERNITRLEDLQKSTPSLVLRPNQGRKAAASYSLRGQGQADTTLNLDSAVGISINEVPLANVYGVNILGFLDVQAVEVLKGPQGTLFGRNTTGGVVNITGAKPLLGQTEGSLTLGAGSHARKFVNGMYNAPLGDNLAFRFAGEFNDRNGLIENLAPGSPDLNDDHYGTVRASLLYDNDTFSTLFIGDYTQSDEQGNSPAANGAIADGFATRYPLGTGGGYQTYSDFVHARKFAAYNAGAFSHLKLWGITNISSYQISDGLFLKNIISYRKMSLRDFNDNDGSPFDILHSQSFSGQNQLSEELQVQYESSSFEAIGGIFFQRSKGYDGSRSIQLGGISVNPQLTRGEFLNKSYAAFLQGTLHITPALDLTVGARYTRDERNFDVVNRNEGTGVCNLVTADIGGMPRDPCLATGKVSFEEPTWNVSLNFKPSQGHLLYATARRGYRSGGFTLRATRPSELDPFRPEFVNDIELGYKGDFSLGGDAALRFNVAAYRSKYTDGIRSQTRCGPATPTLSCPFTSTIFINAAKATIKGIEIESTLVPVDGIELSGFFNYTDAEYDKWQAQGAGGVIVDLSANRFNGVAKYRGGFVVRARVPYREMGDIWATLSGFSTSNYQSQDVLVSDTIVKGYTTLDARLDWSDIGGSPISAGLWVRNLTDREYFVGKYATAGLGLQTAFYGEPRTWGIDVNFRF